MLLSRSSASIPYEIRQYGVRYAIETEYKVGRDGEGFRALAGYIGVGTQPQNVGSKSIAMTAPVVTENKKDESSSEKQQQQQQGEKIAMTAPVITSSDTSTGDKIAMTAPVITRNKDDTAIPTKGGGGGGDGGGGMMKKMAFILPEEYNDMSKIPKPTNSKVVIKEVPSATGAVHTFSGTVNDAMAKRKAADLARQLKEDGVKEMTEEDVLQKYDLWQFHPPFTLGPMRRNEIWVDLTPSQVDELLKKFKEEKKEDL